MKLAMWVLMLVCNLLVPAVVIWYGRRFKKNPPRKVNTLFGYRTNRSMKNQETWDFAQRKMGDVWGRTGFVMLPPVVTCQALTLFCPTIDSMCLWSLPITVVEVALLLLSMVPVERALKKYFDENGVRRQY